MEAFAGATARAGAHRAALRERTRAEGRLHVETYGAPLRARRTPCRRGGS